jgi:hypothetical protein
MKSRKSSNNQNREPKSDLWIDYVGNGIYSLFCQIDKTEARPLASSKNPKELIGYAYVFIGDYDDVVDMSDSVRLIMNLHHMETSGKYELD